MTVATATNPNSPPLSVLRLGRRPYREVWDLQRSLQRSLLDETGGDTLIVCEHDPVLTFGRRSDRSNLLLDREEIEKRGDRPPRG